MSITVYGIANCDSMKKARKWLNKHNIEFLFHDYKKQAPDTALIAEFFEQLPWEQVVNKRGTTYRALSDETKQQLNATNAIPLLLGSPSMIKRPILRVNDKLYLGFKAEQYAAIFNLNNN